MGFHHFITKKKQNHAINGVLYMYIYQLKWINVAMELLKQEVVGIVGPQSTTGSHFIAHMCTSLRVPLVSFGATDPALSEHQYPFFLRLAHNDIYQMQAVADIIRYYNSSHPTTLTTNFNSQDSLDKFTKLRESLRGMSLRAYTLAQKKPPLVLKLSNT